MSEVLYGPLWPVGRPRSQFRTGAIGGVVLGAVFWALGDALFAVGVLGLGLLAGSFLARSAYRLVFLPEGVVRTRGGRSELWRWDEVRRVSIEWVPYRSERLEIEFSGGRSCSIELDDISTELRKVLSVTLAPCRGRSAIGESASTLLWGRT